MDAVIKLFRTRRIEFLGLTKAGLSDFDGKLLVSALAVTPHRVSKSSQGKERLELTQIDFGPDVRVRDILYEAGTAAGAEVLMSCHDGPALGRH